MSSTRKRWKVSDNFTSGFEMEMFTLDKEGYVAHAGTEIIEAAKKQYKEIYVTKEAGRHMIEIGVSPNSSAKKCLSEAVYTLEKCWELAGKRNLLLYPFATYPGRFDPKIRKSVWYDIQKKILGEDKFMITGIAAGFHFHFSASPTVCSARKGGIVSRPEARESETFMAGYNFLIAADPALTTFMQSSPFVQGKSLAKDSRMLIYRGGENLKHDGLYHDFQIFGGLQSYVYTITDLVKLIEKRYDIFKSQVMHWGFDPALIKKYAKRLDTAWNPVKVNKHGTLEQRGMDMNLPSYASAISILLQLSMKRIVNEDLKVVPSDTGMYKPFAVEDNSIYVPPISIVQDKYQFLSATEGLANAKIFRFCKSLYNFALEGAGKDDVALMVRIREMLSTRKTISDKLLAEIEGKGLADYLPSEIAASFAEKWSYEFLDDIEYTKKMLE